MEQRINLKFLVKLGKGPTDCLKLLHEVYGEATMSRARLFEWHKRFTSDREDVEDDPKSGRPSTTKTADNIGKVNELVRSDRRLTVRMMAEELNINRESVRTILLEELHMRKVCAKIVPKLLSDDQKQHRVRVCEDMLERIWSGSRFPWPHHHWRRILGVPVRPGNQEAEAAVDDPKFATTQESTHVKVENQDHADHFLWPKGFGASRVCASGPN